MKAKQPKGPMTPNAPKRQQKQSKVGVMGKDDDGARQRYHRGLLSGKKRG